MTLKTYYYGNVKHDNGFTRTDFFENKKDAEIAALKLARKKKNSSIKIRKIRSKGFIHYGGDY